MLPAPSWLGMMAKYRWPLLARARAQSGCNGAFHQAVLSRALPHKQCPRSALWSVTLQAHGPVDCVPHIICPVSIGPLTKTGMVFMAQPRRRYHRLRSFFALVWWYP